MYMIVSEGLYDSKTITIKTIPGQPYRTFLIDRPDDKAYGCTKLKVSGSVKHVDFQININCSDRQWAESAHFDKYLMGLDNHILPIPADRPLILYVEDLGTGEGDYEISYELHKISGVFKPFSYNAQINFGEQEDTGRFIMKLYSRFSFDEVRLYADS